MGNPDSGEQNSMSKWVNVGTLFVGIIVAVAAASTAIGILMSDVKNLNVNRSTFEESMKGIVDEATEAAIHKMDARIRAFAESNRLKKPDSISVPVKGGGTWGDWRGETFCPLNRYVCGLEQKVEARQGDGDDTALNSVRMLCCLLPDSVADGTNSGSAGGQNGAKK